MRVDRRDSGDGVGLVLLSRRELERAEGLDRSVSLGDQGVCPLAAIGQPSLPVARRPSIVSPSRTSSGISPRYAACHEAMCTAAIARASLTVAHRMAGAASDLGLPDLFIASDNSYRAAGTSLPAFNLTATNVRYRRAARQVGFQGGEMSGRTRTAFVAVLAIAVMPADALAGNGGKPKLEAKEKSQKAILDADAIAVSAKNLDEKITVVAESKSFDSQGFEKISKSTVLKPDDKSGKLALKKSGKRAIASCQPRKIKLARRARRRTPSTSSASHARASCRNSTSRDPASAARSRSMRRRLSPASPHACCPSRMTSIRPRTTRAQPEGALRSRRARCPRTRAGRRSIPSPTP